MPLLDRPPLLLLVALLAACASGTADKSAQQAAPSAPEAPPPLVGVESGWDEAGRTKLEERAPEEYPGLHNVYRLSDSIVSGSEPHGEEALRKISEMGVKTILSVDGKVPDQDTAAKYGMRYVHVPIHYSGISEDELVRIAKTFRECEGPFYVHCFHGKHRGPAGAAVGRLVLDGASRDQALAEMRQWCGTAQKYEGLFTAIAVMEMPASDEIRAYQWDFPAAHPFGGFRQSMIELTRHFDNLKLLAGREWQPDPEHPDLDAVNESAKMADLFAHANALEEIASRPDDFRDWMSTSTSDTVTLAEALKRFREGDAQAGAQATKSFRSIKKNCDACHASYRD